MAKDIHRKQFYYNGDTILISYYKDIICGRESVKCVINDEKDNYVIDIIPYKEFAYASVNFMTTPNNVDKFYKIMKMLNDKLYITDEETILQSIVYDILRYRLSNTGGLIG